jgi:hypothetical protein
MTDVVLEDEGEPILPSKLTEDSVVLECSNVGCWLGPGSIKWSTPSLSAQAATEMVLDHEVTHHMVFEDNPGVVEDWIRSCPDLMPMSNLPWSIWDKNRLETHMPKWGVVRPCEVGCCKNRKKGVYHWNKCSLVGSHWLAKEKGGSECWNHEMARDKKRLENRLPKCDVVKPCEEELHQPTFPTNPRSSRRDWTLG